VIKRKHCGVISPDGRWYCTGRKRGHWGEHVADYVDEYGETQIAQRWTGHRRWWQT
jgi:hypothetical protein